jgi:hypothetical protein
VSSVKLVLISLMSVSQCVISKIGIDIIDVSVNVSSVKLALIPLMSVSQCVISKIGIDIIDVSVTMCHQ